MTAIRVALLALLLLFVASGCGITKSCGEKWDDLPQSEKDGWNRNIWLYRCEH